MNKRVVNLSLAAYILLLFIGITIGALIYLYFFLIGRSDHVGSI